MSAARTWTDADLRTLRVYWAKTSKFEIAGMLMGRHTMAAIKLMAYKLRLKKKRKARATSDRAAEEWQ